MRNRVLSLERIEEEALKVWEGWSCGAGQTGPDFNW